MPPSSGASPTSAVPSADPPVSSTASGSERGWPPEALDLAQRLQRSLTIDDRQWHRLKTQRSRRAAEQLAAALVQLVDHALGWLRAEVSDPGCPAHGR